MFKVTVRRASDAPQPDAEISCVCASGRNRFEARWGFSCFSCGISASRTDTWMPTERVHQTSLARWRKDAARVHEGVSTY